MCKIKKFVVGLVLVVGISVPAYPQTVTTPLPHEAQIDFDKGIAAAKQREWHLAIKHFSQASLLSKHPSILFNLGLAHGKAGHDLAAIAWLHAYLAAVPRTPNAREVATEIALLEISAKTKIQTALQTAINATEVMDNVLERQKARLRIAEALLEVGDLKRAKEVGTNAYVEPAYAILYAKHLGMSGDFYSAGEYLRQTKDSEWHHWGEVCRFWLDVRDYVSARTCTNQIPAFRAYELERENLIKTIASQEKMAQPNPLAAWTYEAAILSKRDFAGDLKLAATPETSKNIPIVIAQIAKDLNKARLKIQALEKFASRPQ